MTTIAELRRTVIFLKREVQEVQEAEQRSREAIQRLSGSTARSMPDDELATVRDETVTALRRMDLEVARRRCRESLAGEASADDASPSIKSFLCPITLEVMEHPVTAMDGNNYERSALETHIAGHATFRSPISNEEFPSVPLIPNNPLRSNIQEELDRRAKAEVDGGGGGARQRRRLE